MNKKIVSILMMTVSVTACAEETYGPEGNVPHGLQYTSIENVQMPPQMKQDIKNMQAFQEKNGYIKKVNQYVPVLLGMKRESEKTLRETAKNKSPYDTSLKRNLSDKIGRAHV